jgi:hypothetical protein
MRIRFRPALSGLALLIALPGLSAVAAELLDATNPLQYVPLQTPCRAVDTRQTGGPIAGGAFRNLNPAGGACSIPTPSGTIAYALNITAIPHGPLGFLTVWPAGELQPTVSTLNSDGRAKANAAIVAGGAGGEISVFASNTADVIVDVNGYFITETPVPPTYTYVPLTPCRLVDTRSAGNTPGFGAPSLTGGQGRTFPLRFSGCNLPTDPQVYGGAFALNVTAIPKGGKALGYLTIWGTPQGYPVDQPPPPPLTSVLNAPTGTTTANAAIVTVNIATDPTSVPGIGHAQRLGRIRGQIDNPCRQRQLRRARDGAGLRLQRYGCAYESSGLLDVVARPEHTARGIDSECR